MFHNGDEDRERSEETHGLRDSIPLDIKTVKLQLAKRCGQGYCSSSAEKCLNTELFVRHHRRNGDEFEKSYQWLRSGLI